MSQKSSRELDLKLGIKLHYAYNNSLFHRTKFPTLAFGILDRD